MNFLFWSFNLVFLLVTVFTQNIYAQKVYFDVKNKVVEVNKVINKEQDINVAVVADKGTDIITNVVVPKIGTSEYNVDYTCTEKVKIHFTNQDEIRTRNFSLRITNNAKTGTTFPLYLQDDSGKIIDMVIVKINQDTSQYLFDHMSFSIGASFAIDKQRANNQDLYSDFKFTKLDLFNKVHGIDAGVSSGVSSISEGFNDGVVSIRKYYQSINENRYLVTDGTIEKKYTVQTTAAWATYLYTVTDNLYIGIHAEYRNRNMEQVNNIKPLDSLRVFKIESKGTSFLDTVKLVEYTEKVSTTTTEGVFGLSAACAFKGTLGEVFIKVYGGYRVQSDPFPSGSNIIFTGNILNEMSTNDRDIGWGAQFRMIETTYGLKFGGEIRGMGLLRPDMFLYVAKEFSISKLAKIF